MSESPIYVGIALLLSMAYINLHPAPYELPRDKTLFFGGIIIVFIPFIFWVLRQISFSIERNYGKRHPFLDQMRFGLYLLCIMAFLTIPIGVPLMMQDRVAHFMDNETLEQDKELLSFFNPFFLTTEEINSEGNDSDICDFHTQDMFGHHGYYTNSSSLKYNPKLSDYQIFKQGVWQNKTEHKTYIETYIKLFNKYDGNIQLSADEIMIIRQNEETAVVNMTHHIQSLADQKRTVKRNISRIIYGKRTWKSTIKDVYELFSTLFLFAFFISLLLSVYNMVQLKDFIISIIGFIILVIGSAIISVFINEIFGISGRDKDIIFILIVIALYATTFKQSLRISHVKQFSTFKTICLVLTTCTTPFVVYWLMILNETISHNHHYHSIEDYITYMWWGILGFLFVAPTFKKLFLKIQSLPKA